eukprot:9654925-Lingulodinium_polyedra.AAC.1
MDRMVSGRFPTRVSRSAYVFQCVRRVAALRPPAGVAVCNGARFCSAPSGGRWGTVWAPSPASPV